MKLSLCITTFNRVDYLTKNVSTIAQQIKKLNVFDQVELIISDDCKENPAQNSIKQITTKYPQLKLIYHLNTINIGPDENFIRTMYEANGEYSILLGDDDFLTEDGLKFIFETVAKYPDIPIFISNRNNLNEKGDFVEHQRFFRKDIGQTIFDFNNKLEARSLFYSITSLGGIMSFPSVVIYKTLITKEVKPYDHSLTGSGYGHQYFFWNYLLQGHKLMYLDATFIDCTRYGASQSNFGSGLRRTLLDFEGYILIANTIFKNSSLKQDLLNTMFIEHSYHELVWAYVENRKMFEEKIIPALIQCGWGNQDVQTLKKICSKRNACITLFKRIMPSKIVKWFKLFGK